MAEIRIHEIVSTTRDVDAGALSESIIEAIVDRIKSAMDDERRRREQRSRDHHDSPAREVKPEPRLASISISFLEGEEIRRTDD